MGRMVSRAVAAGVLAMLVVLALPGPAVAATVLTDDLFVSAPTTVSDDYAITVDGGWWNLVATRGSRFDYDLTLKNPGGQFSGSSALGSFNVDWVAVNANDSCRNAGSDLAGTYTATARRFGTAPASQGDNSPGYNIGRRGGGHVLSVVPKSSPDAYTLMVDETRWTRTDIWDVALTAGTTYRIAWNQVHVYYEGGLFLLPAAAGSTDCVKSRASTSPLLAHSIEVLSGDAEFTTVRTGEVRFTAPTTGWYGLVLTQQTWDLQHVSLGHDNEPHVMIKVA